MMKANSSWLQRTLAMLLVVVTLIGLIPTSVIAAAAESLRSSSYIPGDVNDDGEVNALDINLLRRYIVGGYDVTINTLAADVNADGEINAQDVNNIRRHIAGGYNVELKPGLEPEASTYSVKFYDGDRLIDTLTAEKDQPLGTVPTVDKSSKANAILLGYFTDPECTQPFYAENPVTGDMNVYAKYEEMGSTEELTFDSFAQMDQNPNLSFEIVGIGDPTQAVTLEVKDGSDPVELKFEATADGYIVSAVGGFNEGCSYQLHLADGWTFKDKPDTIHTASFSIDMEEVENLQMSDDIIYILDTDAITYTIGGQSYDMLTSQLITEQGGSFVYSGNAAIKPDDILCIYIGTHPEERGFDGDMLDPAYYVKVAAVNGSTITFTAMGEDDILKLYNIPDNFPLIVDTLPTETTGTTNINKLDVETYSSMMGQDYDLAKAKTLIEVGDFISLYISIEANSSEESVYFGEITAYNAQTGEITFKQTTQQAILDCMDLYRDIEVAGDDLVTEEQKEEIEAIILQQIQDSGFAEDAAFMLADMVSKTDGFKNASLESLLITDSQGNQLSAEDIQLMNLGKSFELTDDITLTVEIITKGDQLHFKKGTQIAVGVEASFEVELEDDEKIAIELNATFVQEVELSPKIKGYIVPYFIGLIPLPVGANINGTVDVKSFTAFSFEAEIYTVAPEDESLWDQLKDVAKNPEKLADFEGFPSELSEGLKTAGDVLDKIEELKDDVAKLKDTAEGTLETIEAYQEDIALLWTTIDHVIQEEEYSEICQALGKTNITSDLLDMMELTDETGLETEYYESLEALMERYCEMVEKETDWVTLLEKDIFEKDVCVYGVAIGIDVDFLVRADLSLAIGSNLQYEVGKRYEFWFKFAPFFMKGGCETMDLLDERFAFQFYVMGRLGLKAGIRAKLECGIGSCKAANVGASVELGPYMKLWGFFVYEYEKYRAANTDEWHSDERMAGALLMEFGLYLKLAFEAEAIGGLFSYEYEFLDEEFPLLTIGNKHFYYQPNYEPAEGEMLLVKDVDNNSQNGITMTLPEYTLALDYVDMRGGYMAIESLDYDRYHYTVSNPNFSIDPKTGEISVTVPEGIRYMECDLTITYKYGKLAFSTYDMTVTVPLVWTNLSTAEISEYYTASVRVGNNEDGYTTVWQQRVLKNKEFDLPTIEEIEKLIGWNEYKHEIGTGYGDQELEDLILIEDEVYDYVIDYDIYSITVNSVQNTDGSTGSRTFYAEYGETFDFSDLAQTGTIDYNSGVFTKFSEVTHSVAGLDLSKAIDTRMAEILNKGVTITANYVDDGITATFIFSGIDAEEVTVKLHRGDTPTLTELEKIAAANGLAIKDITPAVTPITSSTLYQVICGQLDTAPATITFVENGGSNVADITKPYGSIIGALPTPTKTGHTFAGWYVDDALTQLFTESKMPEGGITLYAKWTANKYEVTLQENGGNELAEGNLTVTYGTAYGELPKPKRTGFGFIGWFTAAEGGKQITADKVYEIADNSTLYAQWRELKEISNTIFDFGEDEIFTYQKDVYRDAVYTFTPASGETYTQGEFKVEYIAEGYEDEGYLAQPMEAGTWGVKISRPADDYYAKFEAFYTNVLIIEKAERDLTGIEVVQLNNGYTIGRTYIDLWLNSEIFDLDENAMIRYGFGTMISGVLADQRVFYPTNVSEAVPIKESARIYELATGSTQDTLKVLVGNDRNYEDADIIFENCSYKTLDAPTQSWSDYADTGWYIESAITYNISTPAALAGLAKLVNSGEDFSGKTVRLSNDLDMRGRVVIAPNLAWTPIGTSSHPFNGTFDGRGHTISGLYFSNSSTENVGLFGYVNSGLIQNVVVDDSYFYGKSRVGGIVGNGRYMDVINCTNYAFVKAHQRSSSNDYQSCAGGIAGNLYLSFVIDCVNYGKVYSEGRLTGGIAGYMEGGSYVVNCVNFGSVTGSSRVGGIAGCSLEDAHVFNNYNLGNVRPNDGSNDYIGAIVGRNVDDEGDVQFNYYLYGCAKGGNGKNRYALGTDGGSVEDGEKKYYASSFTSPDIELSSTAGKYGSGQTLINALNSWVSAYYIGIGYDLGDIAQWEAADENSYPLPVGTFASALRK